MSELEQARHILEEAKLVLGVAVGVIVGEIALIALVWCFLAP